MATIEADSRYVTAQDVQPNEVPDGYVIYDKKRNEVHYLNTTAVIVYQLCDGKRSVGDIAEFIKEAYELDKPVELGECIESLLKAELICPAA